MKHYFTLCLFTIFTLTSCTNFTTFGTSEKNQLANQFLDDMAQYDTFDASDEDYTFVSAQDVTLNINPQCLTYLGEPISGEVELKYIEIFDKGTMAITDKHTTAIGFDGNLTMLESGGEFFIELTNNNQKLETECRYSVKYETKADSLSDMRVFKGVLTDENLIWAPAYGDGPVDVKEDYENKTYEFFVDFFDWINCDRFNSFTGPKTNIDFKIPSSKINNTRIYLSFDGTNFGLSTSYGTFPVGYKCHYIIIEEDGNKFNYAIDGFTIEADISIEIASSDFKSASIDELIEIVNNLP